MHIHIIDRSVNLLYRQQDEFNKKVAKQINDL